MGKFREIQGNVEKCFHKNSSCSRYIHKLLIYANIKSNPLSISYLRTEFSILSIGDTVTVLPICKLNYLIKHSGILVILPSQTVDTFRISLFDSILFMRPVNYFPRIHQIEILEPNPYPIKINSQQKLTFSSFSFYELRFALCIIMELSLHQAEYA